MPLHRSSICGLSIGSCSVLSPLLNKVSNISILFYRGLNWGITPLQYSCLENPMDGGASWAAVYGVAEGQTQLSDFTFAFHFHALEKGNGNPLQCPCLEKPRDGEAWWAAVCGVAQSWTRLMWLSSSSVSHKLTSVFKNVFESKCSWIKLKPKCFLLQVCHANPSERARFIRCIYNLLQSSSPAVKYEAAGTLVTLSSAPTAIKVLSFFVCLCAS